MRTCINYVRMRISADRAPAGLALYSLVQAIFCRGGKKAMARLLDEVLAACRFIPRCF